MSRLMTLGVLSQAIDPAAKMATDYCNYVISQGGVVDYNTVYSIYKNEVLTDPDWQKLLYYFDFRAGKRYVNLSTGEIDRIYNLLSPYESNVYIGSPAIVATNERLISGGIRGIPMGSKINPLLNIGIRIENKIKINSPLINGAYPFIHYGSPTVLNFMNYLRTYAGVNYIRNRFGFITDLGSYATHEISSNALSPGTYTFKRICDIVNKRHIYQVPENNFNSSSVIPSNYVQLYPVSTKAHINDVVIAGDSMFENFWVKYYSL